MLDGRLHRGAHGVAGEIAFMPISEGQGTDEEDARRRGTLEAAGSASAVVRAARRAGMRGAVSAQRVFDAAARGDERAAAVVAGEARLVAKAVCAVVTVVDPELVVLGGGIGQAPGFAAAVTAELRGLAPGAARGARQRAGHRRGRGRLPGLRDRAGLDAAGPAYWARRLEVGVPTPCARA